MAYANVDVREGSFNLYSEVTIDSGVVAGYVKPIAVGVKVVGQNKDKEKPLNHLWQSFVGLVKEVFENQKEPQFATKVPLEGNLNINRETGVWPSVWNIFRNAFVKAFERTTDKSVEFVVKGRKKEVNEVKEVKERKKERRRLFGRRKRETKPS